MWPKKTIAVKVAAHRVYQRLMAGSSQPRLAGEMGTSLADIPSIDQTSMRRALDLIFQSLAVGRLSLWVMIDAGPMSGGQRRWEPPALTIQEYRQGMRLGRLRPRASKNVQALFNTDNAFKYLDAKQFDSWLDEEISQHGQSNLGSSHAAKRGAKPKYDELGFKRAALEKLEDEGSFDPSVDPTWNQAKLERYLGEWCRKKWRKEPSPAWIRSKVSQVYAEFLSAKNSKS